MVNLAGDWSLAGPLPDVAALVGEMRAWERSEQVTVDASGLGRWDSVLPAFLFELADRGPGQGRVAGRRRARPKGCAGCWR